MEAQKSNIESFVECVRFLCYDPQVLPIVRRSKYLVQSVDGDKHGRDMPRLTDKHIFVLLESEGKLEMQEVTHLKSEYHGEYYETTYTGEYLTFKIKEDNLIQYLWVYLSQSLLAGEYLLDDEYSSKKLKVVVDLIRGAYDKDFMGKYLHPVLRSVYKVCHYIIEICELTKLQIKQAHEGEIGVAQQIQEEGQEMKNTVFCLLGGDVELSLYKDHKFGAGGDRLAEIVEKLMMSVAKMTHIDISGTMVREDIKRLQELYDYCDLLKKYEQVPFSAADRIIASVLKAIQAKTSLLLTQSFYKPKGARNSPSDLFEEKDVYHNTRHSVFLYSGAAYQHCEKGKENLFRLLVAHGASSEFPFLGLFKELESAKDKSQWNGGGKHLRDYLKFINPKNNDEKIKALQLSDYFAYSREIERLWAKLGERGKDKADTRDEDIKNLIENLDRLRKGLDAITDYISENSAYIRRGVRTVNVNDCLFTIGGVDKVDVFIASYGTPPIFIDILKDEVYPELNASYKLGSLKILGETTKLMSDVTTLAADVGSKDLQYISILGVFAAIIVFVMATTTIFKEADTILEFLSVLFAGFGLTALFLFFFNPKEKNSNPLLMTILASIGLAILIAYFDYFSDKEPATSGSVHLNMSVEGAVSPSGKNPSVEQPGSNSTHQIDSAKGANTSSKSSKNSMKP